ncbi:methyltransferase domain-containing protein [Streptomyces sp. NRRL F-4474]|uniref:methyltransferase domain-containing protein n=1 Tax=Streptomyces sp. NRRL F-4474 TaxID=1463851 RepID=UPI001F3FED5C|nr:methyltransferase domain-containing protein [Streptomyces sp. NRRL F-4474]
MAVEPESHLRRFAEAAAEHAPVPIQVVAGSAAEKRPVAGESFDAAVFSFVLCTAPDADVTLSELRILR